MGFVPRHGQLARSPHPLPAMLGLVLRAVKNRMRSPANRVQAPLGVTGPVPSAEPEGGRWKAQVWDSKILPVLQCQPMAGLGHDFSLFLPVLGLFQGLGSHPACPRHRCCPDPSKADTEHESTRAGGGPASMTQVVPSSPLV